MPSSHPLTLFLSSTHYGLEDLRGEISDFLESLGVSCLLSSEGGFPSYPGMPPYASCLKALERCLMVVGVVDRRYGKPFDDWGPYPEYVGLSPTHAELRHARKLNKRLLVFVRRDVNSSYEMYRANLVEADKLALPKGLDLKTLELYRELKLASPSPWIVAFDDVRDFKRSLREQLLNELYEAILQREATANAAIEVLTEAFLKSSPELRSSVMSAADPQMKMELRDFDDELAELEAKRAELGQARGRADQERAALERTIAEIRANRVQVAESFRVSMAVAVAAAVSGGLNNFLSGRVPGPKALPTITDQQLAAVGIRFSGFSQGKPVVERVTYARVPQKAEDGTWRGYTACLQISGRDFAPGCQIQERPTGSNAETTFGWTPSVYSGQYLELSVGAQEGMPIFYLGEEFRVKNPLYSSEWVRLTFDHDRAVELALAERLLEDGAGATADGRYEEAKEMLMSAHMRLNGLVGRADSRWERSIQLIAAADAAERASKH